MSTMRAIVVAFTALSVAMLPIAAANAHMLPTGTSIVSVHSDCCPQEQHCDKQEKGGCAKFADCELKCASFSGVIPMSSGLVSAPSPTQQPTLAVESLRSTAYIPPPPPPRV
jgi:hypothetical protein